MPTRIELRKPSHIRWSAHSSPNHCSVVPVHGVMVGKREALKVASAITSSGRNR